MLKLVLKIKEVKKDHITVEMRKLTEKEITKSSRLEIFTAVEIKSAIEELMKKIREENMKEGE